jgi:hypothetical protein
MIVYETQYPVWQSPHHVKTRGRSKSGTGDDARILA